MADWRRKKYVCPDCNGVVVLLAGVVDVWKCTSANVARHSIGPHFGSGIRAPHYYDMVQCKYIQLKKRRSMVKRTGTKLVEAALACSDSYEKENKKLRAAIKEVIKQLEVIDTMLLNGGGDKRLLLGDRAIKATFMVGKLMAYLKKVKHGR